MPSPAFLELFDRVFSDETFLARLESERGKALDEFALTGEEREALLSGNPSQVLALGVDERVSKHFGGGTPPPPY